MQFKNSELPGHYTKLLHGLCELFHSHNSKIIYMHKKSNHAKAL